MRFCCCCFGWCQCLAFNPVPTLIITSTMLHAQDKFLQPARRAYHPPLLDREVRGDNNSSKNMSKRTNRITCLICKRVEKNGCFKFIPLALRGTPRRHMLAKQCCSVLTRTEYCKYFKDCYSFKGLIRVPRRVSRRLSSKPSSATTQVQPVFYALRASLPGIFQLEQAVDRPRWAFVSVGASAGKASGVRAKNWNFPGDM